MSARLPFPILVLLVAARGDELEDALSSRQNAFSAFEAQYDALDRRLPRDGALRAALDRAGAERSAMRSLLSEAKDRASAISSAKFKMDFLRREWESARKEAERISAAKDARYEELMNGARATREAKAVDLRNRDPELEAWRGRVNQQYAEYKAFADQVAPLMRTYTLPDEQAAYDNAKALEAQRNSMGNAYEAERLRFSAAIDAWNADQRSMEEEWTRRLAEIEAFVKEDGRRTLEATQVASKKELEFREAETKYRSLFEKVQATLNDFGRRFTAAAGALQAITEADSIRAAASGAASGGGAVPYETRSSAEAAQAVAPPASPADQGGVRAHVFVLPSATPMAESGEAQAEAQRQSAALAAEAIAAQFRPVEAGTVTPADVPPPAPVPATDTPPAVAPPPVVYLGPAPVGGSSAFDDGSAVVVLDEGALTRVFHPGIFIPEAQYRDACAARDRTAELIPKLEQQLERLREQRDSLSGNSQEFDDVRREIAIGAAREVIGVYATRLDMLLKNQAFAAALSATQKTRLEAAKRAFDTLKLGLVLPHADATEKPGDADNLRREAWEEGSAALAELAGSQVGGEWASKFLEQGGNLLKAGGKISRDLNDPEFRKRPWPEEVGAHLKTGIEVVGTWCPPVALGIGLEAVGERGLQWAITQDAVDSLSASVKSTDDAIVFLAEKLRRTQELNQQAAGIVQSHDGASAARRRGFEGGR